MPPPDSPALAPPPGVVPDFYSPYSLAGYHHVVAAQGAILTTVMVIARIYTKRFVLKNVSLEDYSCVVGWLAFIVLVGLKDSLTNRGGGTHQWNVLYKDYQHYIQYTNYCDMVYSLSLLATKLSIMLLIQRIFCSVQRDIAYWLTNFLIFANTAFYTAFLIVPAAQCVPRSKIWNREQPGTCVDINELYVASAVFNLFSDIAMLSVPIFMIWGLQMSIRRKVGVSAIFATGGLACISSILRTVYNVRLTKTDDYTYVHMQASLSADAEIIFGLLCSCLVVLPRLYQHFCDITPYITRSTSTANEQRAHTKAYGRSKKEWVDLGDRAERARDEFHSRARLGDEEAVDNALGNG